MSKEQLKIMELDEIKSIELKILKHFNEFCEKENIRYFLSNGTLLGAVKYNGFIPWDDDIDVLMPREDYDRFIRKYQDSGFYVLFSPERNSEYRFPFAKLCDTGTVKIENNIDNGVELGLDIDIFPIDNWENDLEAAKQQSRDILKLIRDLTFLKQKKSSSGNPVKTVVKRALLTVTRNLWKDKISKMQETALQNREQGSPAYSGCVIWCIYGEREIMPAEVFRETTYVTFEGGQYPAPVGYDMYLRSLYGDYRQDPPPDKQKTHHNFTAYRK